MRGDSVFLSFLFLVLLFAVQWQNAKSFGVEFACFVNSFKDIGHSRCLKNLFRFSIKKKCAHISILTERPSYAPPPTPAPATVSIVIFLINTEPLLTSQNNNCRVALPACMGNTILMWYESFKLIFFFEKSGREKLNKFVSPSTLDLTET